MTARTETLAIIELDEDNFTAHIISSLSLWRDIQAPTGDFHDATRFARCLAAKNAHRIRRHYLQSDTLGGSLNCTRDILTVEGYGHTLPEQRPTHS